VKKVTKAVITVPAYSNDSPTASPPSRPARSRAWKWSASSMNDGGGASLRPRKKERRNQCGRVRPRRRHVRLSSVLEVGSGVVEVKSTNGDTHPGRARRRRDQKIVDWLIDEFKKEHGIDLGKDKMALQRLKEAAEKAKIELSQMMETEINLPFITRGRSGPIHMQPEADAHSGWTADDDWEARRFEYQLASWLWRDARCRPRS